MGQVRGHAEGQLVQRVADGNQLSPHKLGGESAVEIPVPQQEREAPGLSDQALLSPVRPLTQGRRPVPRASPARPGLQEPPRGSELSGDEGTRALLGHTVS